MFLPIGDTPNLPKTPWVTWFLIAANIAVHLALWPLSAQPANPLDPELAEYRATLAAERGVLVETVSAGDLARFTHGFKPGQPEITDAFTSMFLHGGWMHLLGNMLFLWIFGDNVEHRMGRFRFLLAYLGTGLFAILGDSLLRQGSGIPSVGASGAISGVLGFYFAWFPSNRVRVWAFLFPFYIGTLELSARFVLGAYLIVNNILPALFSAGAGGVSHGAHIGGFLAGWALAAWQPTARSSARRVRPAAGATPSPETVVRELAADGHLREAAGLVHRLPPASFGLEDTLSLAERAERAGLAEVALGLFRRATKISDRELGSAWARLGTARVLLRLMNAPTVAYQELAAAAPQIRTPAERAEWEQLVKELRRATANVPRAFRS